VVLCGSLIACGGTFVVAGSTGNTTLLSITISQQVGGGAVSHTLVVPVNFQ